MHLQSLASASVSPRGKFVIRMRNLKETYACFNNSSHVNIYTV
jgi:hypothetical protein